MSLIKSYFNAQIVKKRYEFDEWDNKIEVESARKPIDCRIDYKKKMIKDEDGNDVMMSAIIMTEYDEDILFNDELTIDGKEFVILRRDKGYSFDGVHLEIYV